MIELNPTEYPSDIATLLLLRGAGVPPLNWGKAPNGVAKNKLDTLDDAALCSRGSLADESMGYAVRALLCLLNGWVEDAEKSAFKVRDTERLYIRALCERHKGNFADAKKFLQTLEEYPTYSALYEHAAMVCRPRTEQAFKRFVGIMDMGEMWEAFAFLDLYAQADDGQLEIQAREIVANVQCREFELLFEHCFKQAVGDRPVVLSKAEEDARKRTIAKRDSEMRARMSKKSQGSPAAKKPAANNEKKADPKKDERPPLVVRGDVRVRCPKCKEINSVPGALCGKRSQCKKCSALFNVPYPKKTPAVAGT